MKTDYVDIYEKLIKDGTIIRELVEDNYDSELNSDKVIEILDGSYELYFDDVEEVLYYIDENGEKFICPDLSNGVTESSDWLCDKLPAPFIDFDQGGNVRRIEEARSIYTLVCIGVAFSSLKDEIKKEFKSYDFDEFSYKMQSGEYESLTKYLDSFLSLNSLYINLIVSSASIRISREIEKKDVYWKSMLSLEEITEFARISREVKNIRLRYERKEKLNPDEIKSLSRVQKLQIIDKRKVEINAVIEASEICSVLYKICKLNSERLSPIVKRKISESAKLIAKQEVKSCGVIGRDADELYERTFTNYFRDLSRMAVTTLRTNEVSKYKSNPSNYKFVEKL